MLSLSPRSRRGWNDGMGFWDGEVVGDIVHDPVGIFGIVLVGDELKDGLVYVHVKDIGFFDADHMLNVFWVLEALKDAARWIVPSTLFGLLKIA